MRLVHASCVDMTLCAAPMLCTEAVHAAVSPMTTKKWVECTACQAGLATMLDLILHFILQEASLGRDEQHLASQSQLLMQGCQGISSRPLPPTSTIVACSVNDIPAPVSNDSKHDPSAFVLPTVVVQFGLPCGRLVACASLHADSMPGYAIWGELKDCAAIRLPVAAAGLLPKEGHFDMLA